MRSRRWTRCTSPPAPSRWWPNTSNGRVRPGVRATARSPRPASRGAHRPSTMATPHVASMAKRNDAGGDGPPVPDLIPDRPSLKSVREAARDCRACDLYKRGTQTVFGEGPSRADVMMVAEQPGDAEDLAGHPFVGPAGKLLDRALEEAGIDRRLVYVTNVVKHFKWEPRGKRRIHKKPNSGEVAACRPWLEAEISLVKPTIIVCL